MSEFRKLLERARAAGATRLYFAAALDGYREDDVSHLPWECRATLEPHLPHVGKGRTGEEALREVVKFLERIGT